MNDKIEPPPALGEAGEHRIEACFGGDVGLDDEVAVEAFRERPNPPAERVALIGERKPGVLTVQCPGDAPGERSLIRHAHDEPLLPGHQAHSLSPSPRLRCATGSVILHEAGRPGEAAGKLPGVRRQT